MSPLDLIKKGLNKILAVTDIGPEDTVSVSSEAISQVEYNLETQSLIIEFNSGSRYLFYSIPESIYEGLVQSGSVGRYFVYVIRNGAYGENYIRLS